MKRAGHIPADTNFSLSRPPQLPESHKAGLRADEQPGGSNGPPSRAKRSGYRFTLDSITAAGAAPDLHSLPCFTPALENKPGHLQ